MPLTVNGVNIENVNVNGSPIERVVVNGVEVWTAFTLPIFTGSAVLTGDKNKGQLIMKSSGTLTLSKATYDVFAVGGGAVTCSGYAETLKSKYINEGSYSVVIGAGSNQFVTWGQSGGNSSIQNIIEAKGAGFARVRSDGVTVLGGTGGGQIDIPDSLSGYDGGEDGGNGDGHDIKGTSLGFSVTTRAFQEPTNTLYASGGGGGAHSNTKSSSTIYGGTGGFSAGNGGNARSDNGYNATSATANTGSGGGERGSGTDDETGDTNRGLNGYGGSGVVIIRWGY